MSRLGLLFSLLVIVFSTAFAIPQTIQYQGKLTDIAGVGENATLDIRFRIFDVETSGDSLWAQTIAAVPIVHGLFDVNLGPIDLPFDEQYWLEIIVDGSVLAPRMPLTSSPYAFRAAVADSFTGGVAPWTQDTMVAHWDSLRGIPADIADGDQFDTTIAHWGDIRDIPADIADGDDIIGTQDTMIAHWDSLRGIPTDLGNKDTIWSKDAATTDTIVIMANAKIHGELIADSIQAEGGNIALDDHIDIYGCAYFYAGAAETLYTEGFESGDPPIGWEEVEMDYSAFNYVLSALGYYPTEGTYMAKFECMYLEELGGGSLQQITGFSSIGYSSLILYLDILHYTGPPSYAGLIIISFSLDGVDWQVIDTLHRYNGTTGWATETMDIPGFCSNQPEVFIRLYSQGYEENIYFDNLIITGRGNSPPYELMSSICGQDFSGNFEGIFSGDGSMLEGTEDDDWFFNGIKMYSRHYGYVGIGTSDPIDVLHLHYNGGTFGRGLRISGITIAQAPGITIDNPENNRTSVLVAENGFILDFRYGSAIKVKIDTLGNVDVLGDVTANAFIIEAFDDTIGADDSVFISVRNTCNSDSAFAGIRFKSHSTDGNSYYKSGIVFQRTATYGRGDILFLNDNQSNATNADFADAKMAITPAGNIGINIRNPQNRLEVKGSTVLNGSLNWGGTSSSGPGGIYEITINGIDSYSAGMLVAFQSHTACAADPSLAINGMVAKDIKHANNDAVSAGEIGGDDLIILIYNGSNFRWISD